MVSTRGIKVKFSEGERVLCYEPDPSKAKVLYDSKVLQVIHNKDGKGRKQVEYLIHFQGWNASWDRRVTEDFVLKYTDENRELQKQLAEKSHIKLSIKSNRVLVGPGSSSNHRKRKRRLSETIRETIERERKNKADSDTSSKTGATEDDMSSLSSEVESSTGNEEDGDEEERKEETKEIEEEEEDLSDDETIVKNIPLIIPESLKAILLKDHYQINEKNKLVNLPSDKPILTILEDYVKFFSARYISHSGERRRSDAKEKERAYMTLDLCKEFVDGLRICFDFYVYSLLLYAKEKQQAEEMKKATPLLIDENPDVKIKNLCIEMNVSKNQLKDEKEEKKETPTRRVLRSKRVFSEESPVGAPPATADNSKFQGSSCESGRSTPSTLASGASGSVSMLEGSLFPLHLRTMSADLQSWTLLPESYRRSPFPPVLLYGSVHLLRLFVKMPEILYKMNLSPERKKIVMLHMDMFLEYLNVNCGLIFSEFNYINSSEI